MTSKEIETLNLMLQVADARIKNLVDLNDGLTLEVERLTEALKAEKATLKAYQDHVNAVDDFEIAVIDTQHKRVIN
tara:strand:+ start:18779 stop:19006 length:228 start_codon:yes stop_codon:yes gene_type:complete